jgi:peptidoglycan-N-acetylglucosamine deacetylase
MPSPQRPIASLSLDLDNQWSYLRVHGDSGWEDFPSYLDIVVPRVLELLSLRKLRITFFVVGRDAALGKNHEPLRAIGAAGHEIGNHSFSHEPWFHRYTREKIRGEIQSAEEHIAAVTGQLPVGFRGPGFSFSETTLEVLEQRGYLYDASTFPTFCGPLARFYYFLHSHLSREHREDRDLLFGSFWEGLRPLKPYYWGGKDRLLEIPVTTLPLFRVPFHMSYILYLSSFSRSLAMAYLRGALLLCRLAGVSPSLLLHPLDFLGRDDHVGLDFFPAMQLFRAQKLSLVDNALRLYCDQFEVHCLKEHARRIAAISKPGIVDYYAGTRPSLKNSP